MKIGAQLSSEQTVLSDASQKRSAMPTTLDMQERAVTAKLRYERLHAQALELFARHQLLKRLAFKQRAFHRLPSTLKQSRYRLQAAIAQEVKGQLSSKEKLKQAIFLENLRDWMLGIKPR